MTYSTVCICARDPASRALARASFEARTWYLIEATPEDLHLTLRAVKLDVLVYVGPERELGEIRATIAAAQVVVPRLVSIADADRACARVSRVSRVSRE